MAFAIPEYSRKQVTRAGEIVAGLQAAQSDDWVQAYRVVTNWRASHAYPINTFQATLRKKLKAIEPKALVAQRLNACHQ